MAAVPANDQLRVWLCGVAYLDANGESVPTVDLAEAYGITFLAGAAWYVSARLIPNESVEMLSSIGTATFSLLRQNHTEIADNQDHRYTPIIEGMYVIIDAASGAGPLVIDNALWIGWITHIDVTNVSGLIDAVGSVTARQLGDLMDKQQMRGWSRLLNNIAQTMDSPPSANIGDPAGQIIGNCIPGTTPVGAATWLFASTPTDFGYAFPKADGSGLYAGDTAKYFTRWRLLNHAIAFCRTRAMPPITILCGDDSQDAGIDPTDITTIAGFLNQTTLPEIFAGLDTITWRGFLDLMIPRDRNLGWTLSGADSSQGPSWVLYIYTAADDEDYGMPANTNTFAIDATVEPLTSIEVVEDVSDLPDKIIIEGANCIFAGTFGLPDMNANFGWNTANQAAYFAGASALPNYGLLSLAYQIEQNRLLRSQAWLKDVFCRFVVAPFASGDIRVSASPGNGSGSDMAFCPRLDWTAGVGDAPGSLAIGPVSATPYIGSNIIQRTLPVPYGYKSDGTDQRTQWQKIQPQYLPLRAFLYDTTRPVGLQWVDLSVPSPLFGNARASISPDDRGAAVRVEFSPRELLAKNIWPNDGSAAPADIDPNGVGFDPNTLLFTIALESDQKIRIERNRPGLGTTNAYVTKPLIIRIPRLQCMAIHQGSIIGLAGTSGVDTPDRWTATHLMFPGNASGIYFFRNDWALADLYSRQAANWGFRPRQSITVTRLLATDTPEWAQIGSLITNITESAATADAPAVSYSVSTVVESIRRTYGASPRMMVTTSLPKPPTFMGASAVHSSPSAGGPISTALGATPAQAIQILTHHLHHLHKKLEQAPLITAMPYQTPDPLVLQIVGGQSVNGVPGIQYAADPVTAPKAYNPKVDTSYIAGLGYGTLYDSSGRSLGLVLVRHNWSGFTDPLVVGNRYLVGPATSVNVTGGSTIPVYPVTGM